MKKNISKESVCCCICQSNNFSIIAQTKEHEFDDTTDDLFNICRCNECKLIFINPRPTIDELPIIYPPSYYCHVEKPSDKEKISALKNIKQMIAKKMDFPARIERILKQVLTDNRGKVINILDVGCGNGEALDIFKQIGGEKVRTSGVDFSESAIKIVSRKNHNSFLGRFEEIELPKNNFDIIWSSHVIEHVADPKSFMLKINQCLSKKGLFFCETPNVDSIEARYFIKKGVWGGLHTPRHWNLFSPETFNLLATKAGLIVEEINFNVVPVFWAWTFHAIVHKTTGSIEQANKWFPIVPTSRNYLWRFILFSFYTILDYAILCLFKQTSAMQIILKKHESECVVKGALMALFIVMGHYIFI